MDAANSGVAIDLEQEGVMVGGEISAMTYLVDGPGVAPEELVEITPSVGW